MAEIAEAVAAAAEGIVAEVLAVAVVRAAGAIAVLVAVVEIAAIAKPESEWAQRTAPHYLRVANSNWSFEARRSALSYFFLHLTKHERPCCFRTQP